MPIPNQSITPADFNFLSSNIVSASEATASSAAIMQAGLQYVVDLSTIAPSIDLVNPYGNNQVNLEQQITDSTFTAIVAALDTHIINRATTLQVGDTPSTRLNRYLSTTVGVNPVNVVYGRISAGAGFVIDGSNQNFILTITVVSPNATSTVTVAPVGNVTPNATITGTAPGHSAANVYSMSTGEIGTFPIVLTAHIIAGDTSFVGWSGDYVQTSSPLSLGTVGVAFTTNINVTATFA